MDIENITKWVSILTGIFGILGAIFGKSIYEVIKEWRQGNSKRKQVSQNGSSKNHLQRVADPAHDLKTKENEAIHREKILSFSELVKSGKYQKALVNALPERNKLENELKRDDPDRELLLYDFDVWHARALIYTGKTNDGLKMLDAVIEALENDDRYTLTDRLENEVLARSHNDRGYAYWMDKGNYELAVEEFNAAIKGFLLSCTTENGKKLFKGPWEELATAYDNLGRIYVQLGNQTRAEIILGYGRKLREDICNHADASAKNRAEYRYALSLNSIAISHLAFGEPYEAYKFSDLALKQFRSLPGGRNSRGTGLALITKGQSLREIGKMWRDNLQSRKSYCEGVLKLAIDALAEAEKFFTENEDDSGRIWEPIRLCQIKNEIGCAHRELAELNDDMRIAKRDGRHYLEESKRLAKDKFPLLFLDGCEDLARLHLLVGNEKLANAELDAAEEMIKSEYSPAYVFSHSTEKAKLDPKDCIEEIWQYLGKIYALRGHIALDRSNLSSSIDDALKEAIHNYILAMGYFGRFAESARDFHFDKNKDSVSKGAETLKLVSHQAFLKELYSKLITKDTMVMNQLVDEIVPSLAKKYGLKKVWIKEFYDIADLIIQTKPPGS